MVQLTQPTGKERTNNHNNIKAQKKKQRFAHHFKIFEKYQKSLKTNREKIRITI